MVRLGRIMLVCAIVLSSAGCAGFNEWLTTPSPITGTAPAEDVQDAVNAAFRGDWVTLILKISAITAAGVGSVFVGKKAISRVRKAKPSA